MRRISAFNVQVRGKSYKTPEEITNRVFQLEVSKRSEIVREELKSCRKLNETSSYFDRFAVVPFVKPTPPPRRAKQEYKRFKKLDDYLECLTSGQCVTSFEALDLVSKRISSDIGFMPATQTARAILILADHSHPSTEAFLSLFRSKLNINEHYKGQLDFESTLPLLEYLPTLRSSFLPYIASTATFNEVSIFARTAELTPEDREAIAAALNRLKRQSPESTQTRPVNLFNFSEDPTNSEIVDLEKFLVLR